MNNRVKGNIILLLCAAIWGSTFVAQVVGCESIGPFTFIGVRNVLTVICLLPVFFCFSWANYKKTGVRLFEKESETGRSSEWSMECIRYTLLHGLPCGIFLFGGMFLQQAGIKYTTVAKSGFLTSMYMIFVPVIGLILGKKLRKIVLPSVIIAIMGMYLLCITDSFSLSMGDSITLCCALCYAFQIMSVDACIQKANPLLLSIAQFCVAAVIGCIGMLILEKPEIAVLLAAWAPLAYAGIASGAIAYTLQIFGQRYAEPTVAGIIMSLESVFSLLAGWLILGQVCTIRQLVGCGFMMTAIILVQLPEKN